MLCQIFGLEFHRLAPKSHTLAYRGHEFPKSLPTWYAKRIIRQYYSLELTPQVSQPGTSQACSAKCMVLSFPKVSQPGFLKAYSGNIMVLSFPKVSQSGILEAYSGSIMVLTFPKVSEPGILEAYLCTAIAWRFPKASQPGTFEAYPLALPCPRVSQKLPDPVAPRKHTSNILPKKKTRFF